MDQIFQLLIQNGVTPQEIVYIENLFVILIMIPVVSTILAISRYIIGIRTPNIFAVLVLTFAFIELSFQDSTSSNFLQGLKYGALLYSVVVVISTITYFLIRKFRMHYVPKMSIVFTAVSIGYIILILLARANNMGELLIRNTFLLVIIATLAENIVTTYARKDLKFSLDQSIRTFIVSGLAYLFVSIDSIRRLLIDYPYLIILIVVLNIYIGKFKGLRITEYFRFKSILLSRNTDEQIKPDSQK